jgi:hypothetical protein
MEDLGISLQQGEWGGPGITLEEVFLMPRSKKVIIHTYSCWQNPATHESYGTKYFIAEPEMIADLAGITGNEDLMALVPEAEDK